MMYTQSGTQDICSVAAVYAQQVEEARGRRAAAAASSCSAVPVLASLARSND